MKITEALEKGDGRNVKTIAGIFAFYCKEDGIFYWTLTDKPVPLFTILDDCWKPLPLQEQDKCEACKLKQKVNELYDSYNDLIDSLDHTCREK